MIFIKNKKSLIFTDIHWGKSRDSQNKVESNIKTIKWIISLIKEHDITDVFFLGDWFDDRNSINVKTSMHARESLIALAELAQIYMIVGNHDAYFKNTIDVHSLAVYEGIKNVHIIDKITEFDLLGNTCALYPWDTFNKSIDSSFDIIMGHFEWEGAVYVPNSTIVGNVQHYNGDDLTTVAPIVFSGHYHIRKEYSYKNGKVYSVGCPLQLDWGDYKNPKGCFILNNSTLDFEFIPNPVAPTYIKIYYSEYKKKKPELKNIVKDNYVRLVIDSDYEFSDIVDLISKVNSYSPVKPCETDYTFNNLVADDVETTNTCDEHEQELVNINTFEAVKKFVDMNPNFINDSESDIILQTFKNYFDSVSKK